MKRNQSARADMLSFCTDAGPEDGADPKTCFRKRSAPVNRKALQLCAQVAQALGYVMSWETSDDVIAALTVDSVVPAPNSSHLLVTVAAPGDASVDEIVERLQGHLGRLRAEVAKSIHRKRVPELSFRILRGGEGPRLEM